MARIMESGLVMNVDQQGSKRPSYPNQNPNNTKLESSWVPYTDEH